MSQYHTVIPIHNLELNPEASYEFGGGLMLTALPPWIVGHTVLDSLSLKDREAVEQATHAFVFTYPADALGSADPDWKGANQKSIQETKHEVGIMANLALWLARPSPICFAIVFHACQTGSEPIIQQFQRYSELLCHPDDVGAKITEANLADAINLHKALLEVTRDTALWTAVRAAWAGLQMNIETIRYLLFWVALEALFGPEDGREITYRLSQRVGFFLGANRAEARQLFEGAKAGYSFRSKIAHGRWKEGPNATKRMAEAETMFRRALVQILEGQELVVTFSTKTRENFLESLVFNGAA